MSAGIIGQRTDIPDQPKPFYQRPLFWVLGATAVTAAVSTYFLSEDENDNPFQLADFGSMLADIAVSAGAIAISIAGVPLAIYTAIMAAKDNQVNFNNDLSNRDLQEAGSLPNDLKRQLEEAYQSAPALKDYESSNDRRRNRNSKRDSLNNKSQNSSQKKQSRAGGKRATDQELAPIFPTTGDIPLNFGPCVDGYSSKVLSNGNVATACHTRDFFTSAIYFGIDNADGDVVLASKLISEDNYGSYPDLVQEPTSNNIGIAWFAEEMNSVVHEIYTSQGQEIGPLTASVPYGSTQGSVFRHIGVKGSNFFTFSDVGGYIYWQEIASSNGNLVGSSRVFKHSDRSFRAHMAMVETDNGNMIAMYVDDSGIMRRQTFTSTGLVVGDNHDLGYSESPDMVAMGNKVYGVRESRSNIFLDKLNQDGTADGPAITIATDATGVPRIAANKNYIAVVYPARDGDCSGAFARIYDKDGVPIQDSFCVNANTIESQTDPQVSWTPEGRLTVFFLNADFTPTMRTFRFNSPPIPNAVPPEMIFVNQPFNKTYTAEDLALDPDGDAFSFIDEGGVPWGTFNATSLTLNLTAPPGSQGDYNWFFGGDDSGWNGAFTGGRIPFEVVNRAPTITGSTMISGFPLEKMGPICLTKSDLDQDSPLTIGFTGRGVVNGTDCWTFTPGSDDIGTGTVNVTVTDPFGAKDFHLFSWEVINRKPLVNKGFGNHNVTAGDSFAIVVGSDAYDDLDEHPTSVTNFGSLENWMAPNIGMQTLTGSAPMNAIGQVFNIHPMFCDSYASCAVDRTGSIAVLPPNDDNAIPTQTKNFPSPKPIGSGWDFSYRVDVRDYFVDLENDPLIASVTSPFSSFPEWFESNVTSDVIVDFSGKSPSDFAGSVTPMIKVRDTENSNGISELLTFNIVAPESLAPKINKIVNELIFDVGKEKWISLPRDVFFSSTGSSIKLSIETKSAGLDNTWSHYKKTKWLKITQDNQGNWLIGGKPGKKATNGAKVTLTGCDDHNLCTAQQFFARVDGMSPLEEFVTYGGAAVTTLISAGFAYWWKYGRNGEWRNHKRTVEHYCGEKKDQIKRCWTGNNANKDIALQGTGSLNEGLLNEA